MNTQKEKPTEGDKKYTLEELEKDLEDNHKKFCHEHIKHWEKARSYMRVYPDSTYEAAAVSANRLLKNAKIVQYIDFIKDDIAKEAGISKLSLINELKLIAFSNLPLIILKFEKDGLEGLTEDEQKVILEYTHNKKELGEEGSVIDTTTKLKLHDKRGAIQDILKAMGWNEPDKLTADISIHPFLDLMKQSTSDNK